FQSLCESDLEVRLREAIRQRDEQWRRHEREQIVFLQNETAAMLRGLHKEIERLGYQLKDAKRQLYVPDDSPCDHSEMEAKIEQQQERIRQLEQASQFPPARFEIREREKGAMLLTAKRQKQLRETARTDQYSDRIRQLSNELNERNQALAVLSSQLRSYRLRDAMATAQQRRRASTSPIVSPSSPHRIFPPKGLVSASVTVSYPGSQTGDRSGSVDRILRRKSASNVGMNKTN
ncbi:hypothetical protein OSTOST_19095, partial [Ostertagia ostertagi]